MSQWRTEKQFASWLGLAPNNKSSAGKIKSRQSKPTNNCANKAFRLAVQSVSRTQSALGAFFQWIKAKYGTPVAITATAHKLARLVYHLLKHRQPYHDLVPNAIMNSSTSGFCASYHGRPKSSASPWFQTSNPLFLDR